MRCFDGPTLLVIDELGCLALPAMAASALFQGINQRYLKTSIVITINRPVDAWGKILGDTTVAAAMLDRLLHRCIVVSLDGDSYGLRAHHDEAEQLCQAVTARADALP
ncbi:ATP-binding protein [Citricoccus nitrophenolicus]